MGTSFDNTNDSLHEALTQCLQTCRARYAAAENAKTRGILRDRGDVDDTSSTDSSGGQTPISSTSSASCAQNAVLLTGMLMKASRTSFALPLIAMA